MNFLLDLLFPRRCLSCGRLGEYICDHCVSMIQFIDTNICPVCEKPAVDGRTHPRCQTKYSLDGLTSIFSYQGVIREAIKKIKYKPFVFDISKTLTSLALEKVNQKNPLFSSLTRVFKQKPILVSVPLYRSREYWRGFNQAEVLGRIIAEELNLTFLKDLLLRRKATKPQVKLKGEKRKDNVRGAFKINSQFARLPAKQAIRNSKIILVDDVWTTGATMRTCGNILKRSGIKFVWGLTLAR